MVDSDYDYGDDYYDGFTVFGECFGCHEDNDFVYVDDFDYNYYDSDYEELNTNRSFLGDGISSRFFRYGASVKASQVVEESDKSENEEEKDEDKESEDNDVCDDCTCGCRCYSGCDQDDDSGYDNGANEYDSVYDNGANEYDSGYDNGANEQGRRQPGARGAGAPPVSGTTPEE
ncbi:uncharacterized protein [Euphorbia lathyris]|uniref:uncharacterized protein n=1 Tax=Euphorbia lathyris TaxID=212925 RepID=UPI003314223E